MRRPLFGNGIPRNILNADDIVELFNTDDFNPNDVYAVTLFVWWFQPGAAPTDPTLLITCSSDGGAPLPIANVQNTFLNALWAGPAVGSRVAPLKVLDRYLVRGDQQLFCANSVGGAASCFVWGYFEQVGSENPPRPFRGLQPGPLVSPYVFEPVYADLAEDSAFEATLHQLSPTYIDLVTLDVAVQATATAIVAVTLPGGLILPMPSESSGFPFRVFDGIPMRAPSSTDINIKLVATTAVGETVAALVGYGGFDRF